MRGPHDGANVDCTAEYRWENNSSAGKAREMTSRPRERGDRDSTRPIPGLRVRLVKSFAGIMNPPRVVIPTFVDVTTRRVFLPRRKQRASMHLDRRRCTDAEDNRQS